MRFDSVKDKLRYTYYEEFVESSFCSIVYSLLWLDIKYKITLEQFQKKRLFKTHIEPMTRKIIDNIKVNV